MTGWAADCSAGRWTRARWWWVVFLAGVCGCGAVATVEGPGTLGRYRSPEMESAGAVAVVEGDLDDKDGQIDGGSYGDSYSFRGLAGETVRLSLVSDEIDPYLYLYGPDGRLLAEDDDGGEGLEALVTAVLPDDGVYVVMASSYSPEQGVYRLRVERGMSTARYPLLEVPGELRRRFGMEARFDESGNPYHVYALDLLAGRRLEARLDSTETDPLLRLYDGAGQEVAADDDSGGALNALLVFEVPADGRYYLVTTTFSPPYSLGGAAYHLDVSQLEP